MEITPELLSSSQPCWLGMPVGEYISLMIDRGLIEVME